MLSVWSFCNSVQLFYSLSVYILRLKILSIRCVFPISLENVFCTVLQHLCDADAPCKTNGSLRCDELFSLWAFPQKKKSSWLSIWKQMMTFLRTCFFTSSLALRSINQHSHCVCPRVAHLQHDLQPYCVCDHEKFMIFKIALFLNSVLGILRDLLVVLTFLYLGNNYAIHCLCSGIDVIDSSVAFLSTVFSPRRQPTDLILLALGDQYKSFGLGLCYHALGFHQAVSMYGCVGLFSRAASIYGCTGSSSVPEELYERVTSMTCVGLG